MSAAYFLKLESDENGPPTAAQLSRALRQRQGIQAVEAKRAGIQPYQWQSLGPVSVGGRVRAIAFDPANTNRVLAGTASGGLWSSGDLGNSWQVDNDFLANLSITTIVFAAPAGGTFTSGTSVAPGNTSASAFSDTSRAIWAISAKLRAGADSTRGFVVDTSSH